MVTQAERGTISLLLNKPSPSYLHIRATVADTALVATSLLSVAMLGFDFYRAQQIGWLPLNIQHFVGTILILAVMGVRQRLPLFVRTGALLGYFFVYGIAG